MNISTSAMKVILLTGSTDGIGFETAKRLASEGHHHLLLHGRSASKLKRVARDLDRSSTARSRVETYQCDLSKLGDIAGFANQVKANHKTIDVIINNAGVLSVPNSKRSTAEGLDVRFAVNTIAPYLLAKSLLPLLDSSSRIINVSSAAEAQVNLAALKGEVPIYGDMAAYAQSKLAITMWSRHMAAAAAANTGGPTVVSVNPGSLLGSKMVKEAFGIPGNDLGIGADILVRAALSDEFDATASGKYYDNDNARFSNPHPDALDPKKCQALVSAMDDVLESLGLV